MSSTDANPNAAPTTPIGHVHHHHEEVQARAEARAQELGHHAHGHNHHHGEAHPQDAHDAQGHAHHEGHHDHEGHPQEGLEHHEGRHAHGHEHHGEHHTAGHEHHEGHHPHGEHDGHHHAQGGEHHPDEHHRAHGGDHTPAQHRHDHEHHHTQEATQGQAPHHGHHHHHHHGQPDFADANRRHYDETAEDYDSRPRHMNRAIRVGKALREAVHLNQETSSALEFASGTGLVARQLLPHVKEMVGIDISPGAVERCNKHFKDMGAGEGSYAVVANIMTDKNVLEGKKFDLVYCASAYHHFEHPEEITKALAGFLKPGGSLVIVDNIQKGGEVVDEKHKAYVTRYGFNEEDMKGFFAAAGLKFKSYSVIPPQPEDNDIFIATGVLEA